MVTSTVLSGAKCYAVSRKIGFEFMVKKGISSPNKKEIEAIIRKNNLGEINVSKNFLRDGVPATETKITNQNSHKMRAVLFRRTLVGYHVRQTLDRCKFDKNSQSPKQKLSL